MPWLSLARVLFDTRAGKGVAIAAGFAVLVATFAVQQRSIGAAGARQKQEKVDAKVIRRGEDAARRSADPRARGVRDPYAAAE